MRHSNIKITEIYDHSSIRSVKILHLAALKDRED